MKKFSELGLKPEILQAIEKLGFETPLPVQAQAIPFLLETRKDLIGLAQTGTGKTAAFGLPIVNDIDGSLNKPQAVILAPTRELCIQITNDIQSFAKFSGHINVVSVYGGADIARQLRAIAKGAHIIVATPGRMNDLLNKRKKVDFSCIKTLVLDEADEMLNMGFKDELDAILDRIPKNRQTLLFSATMSKEVQRIAANYMQSDAEEITVGSKNSGADTVSHVLYSIRSKDRYIALKRILDFNPNIYGIVFCRTRMETKRVAAKLVNDGYNADALHGDLSQPQREYIMQKFRVRNLQMLVATDVAARGLDVKDITHIVNYELPDDVDTYTHRSGRTGRAGQTGISIVLAHLREKGKISQIERKLSKKFEIKDIPTGKEICEQQLLGLIERMHNTDVNHEEVDKFLPVLHEKLGDIDKEELLKRFISLEFNRFFDYYKKQKDLTSVDSRDDRERGDRKDRDSDRGDRRGRSSSRGRDDRDKRGDRRERSAKNSDRRDDTYSEKMETTRGNEDIEQGFSRFFVNLGYKDGVNPRDIIELVNKCTEKSNINIGKIELMKSFSFFEADKKYTTNILQSVNNVNVNNKDIFVELALEDPKSSDNSENKKRRSKNADGAKRKRAPKTDRAVRSADRHQDRRKKSDSKSDSRDNRPSASRSSEKPAFSSKRSESVGSDSPVRSEGRPVRSQGRPSRPEGRPSRPEGRPSRPEGRSTSSRSAKPASSRRSSSNKTRDRYPKKPRG
jgi:ATP-dependent RNA helicase DeaD